MCFLKDQWYVTLLWHYVMHYVQSQGKKFKFFLVARKSLKCKSGWDLSLFPCLLPTFTLSHHHPSSFLPLSFFSSLFFLFSSLRGKGPKTQRSYLFSGNHTARYRQGRNQNSYLKSSSSTPLTIYCEYNFRGLDYLIFSWQQISDIKLGVW